MANGKHPGGRRGYGNSYDRRTRREWLVQRYGSPTGKTIRCWHCKRRMLTKTRLKPLGTFVVDRYPICGHLGGTYRRDNIVPSCQDCNAKRCHPRKRLCAYYRAKVV